MNDPDVKEFIDKMINVAKRFGADNAEVSYVVPDINKSGFTVKVSFNISEDKEGDDD